MISSTAAVISKWWAYRSEKEQSKMCSCWLTSIGHSGTLWPASFDTSSRTVATLSSKLSAVRVCHQDSPFPYLLILTAPVAETVQILVTLELIKCFSVSSTDKAIFGDWLLLPLSSFFRWLFWTQRQMHLSNWRVPPNDGFILSGKREERSTFGSNIN